MHAHDYSTTYIPHTCKCCLYCICASYSRCWFFNLSSLVWINLCMFKDIRSQNTSRCSVPTKCLLKLTPQQCFNALSNLDTWGKYTPSRGHHSNSGQCHAWTLLLLPGEYYMQSHWLAVRALVIHNRTVQGTVVGLITCMLLIRMVAPPTPLYLLRFVLQGSVATVDCSREVSILHRTK